MLRYCSLSMQGYRDASPRCHPAQVFPMPRQQPPPRGGAELPVELQPSAVAASTLQPPRR